MNTDDLGASTETTTSGKTVGHGTKKNVDLSSLIKESAHISLEDGAGLRECHSIR